MKRPAVFFDRDNTLIACDEYLGDPEKVRLVDGAAEAVARARRLGYATVIFSNQSGVARGYFTEEAVHAVNARLDEMLSDAEPKAVIDRHEFCPYHPEASIERYRQDSPLRKPGAGMIHQAAEALALDLSRSWVIGDAPRDIEAGHAAGCRTILFTDSTLKASPAALAERKIEPDYVCTTLREAMDFIERSTERAEEAGDRAGAGTSDAGAAREVTDVKSVTAEARESPQATDAKSQAADKAAPAIPVASVAAVAPVRAEVNSSTPVPSTPRLETIALDILHELRRRHEQPQQDFSVSKLLAGITQVVVVALLFMAFLYRSDQRAVQPMLLFALTIQTMTIALLIMGRQR